MEIIQMVGLISGAFLMYGVYASWRASLIEKSNFLRKSFYTSAEIVLKSSIDKPALRDQIFWMSENLNNSRVIFSILRMITLSKIGLLSTNLNKSRDSIDEELGTSNEKIREEALKYMCCFILLHCYNSLIIGAPLRNRLFWKLMRTRTGKNSQIKEGTSNTKYSDQKKKSGDIFWDNEKLSEAKLKALAVTLHSPPDERAHAA